MSAPTALYRRYRPDSFTDVIGQEHVTAPLMAALEKNRVNHAYLFSGPRGCGKTTSARILARCLNCAQGPTSHPCGSCDSCVELARGGTGSLDVIEIDAASHGGVDDARDLRERATFAPIRDRYKIFIIDEAHMVTSAGFNALLKIVEEPPEHIKFIFATTEPDKVIGTIRSRTHHYPFRLVPPEPLMAYLAHLCEQENVPVAPGVLSLVIRAGGGSVRDSLSVLDQLMAGAGAAGLDYDLAVDLLGYTHASLLDDVVEALAAADSATVFKSVDRVIQTGHDPRRFVEDLLERFRDLIIVQAMPESAHAILRGTPDELIARMQTQAAQLGAAELSRAADVTNTAFNEMTGATSPRLHLELLGARLLLPGADTSARGMAARLDQMERRLNYGGAPTTTGAPATAAAGPSADLSPSTTPSLADTRPVAEGGGLAAVRAQLAKAKAEAGAQVASRHQGSPEQSDPAALPPAAGAQGAPDQHAPVQAAPEPASLLPATQPSDAPPMAATTTAASPASTPAPSPAAPGPHRTPTWDDLEPAASGASTASPAIPAGPAAANGVAGPGGDAPTPVHAPDPAPPAQPASAAPQDAAAPAGQAAGGTTGIEVIRRAWPEILGNLSNIRKVSWAMVNQNVVPRAFDGETLRVALPTTALIQTFNNSGHAENLRQAIHTTLGITCQLDPITGDAPNPGSSAEPNPKGLADPRLTGGAGRPPSGAVPAGGAPDRQAPASAPVAASAPTTGRAPASAPDSGPAAAPAPAAERAQAPAHAATTTATQTPTPNAAAPALAAAADVPPALPSQTAPNSAPEAINVPATPQPHPSARFSEWDGPIPEEPSWLDEPPHDDWAETAPAYSTSGTPADGASDRGASDRGAASPVSGHGQIQGSPQGTGDSPVAVQHSETKAPEPSHFVPGIAPASKEQAATGAPAQSPAVGTGSPAPEPSQAAPEPVQAAAPYRPKVSPISAWTSGWDLPEDNKPDAPATAPEEPAAPRRSQLLAAQAQQNAQPTPQQESPQDWGVSLGGPSRNNVADPGWGAPANAPDWAQPAAAPSGTSPSAASPSGSSASVASTSGVPSSDGAPAGNGAPGAAQPSTTRSDPGLPGAELADGGQPPPPTPASPAQEGAATVSPGTASNAAAEQPAQSAGEKISMYQRLSNSPEARAGRTHAPARTANVPYVEDVPSPDDVTIEESGVAGQAAVERILGGALIEEKPLNGSSF